MKTPEISFLCASYNHGRYVVDFLRSLLAQTNPNWECVLVDDCSSDNNVEAALSVQDPRIKLVRHSRNEGMTKSLQDAFYASSASIVSWVASDDVLECQYAETVLSALSEHPGSDMVYTPLSYMQEDGTMSGRRSHLPIGMSRRELVSKMFLGVNLLHSPGMAVRRDVFAELLPLDIATIQFTDWQMHLRLLCRHEPVLLGTPIVRYRISHNSACARSRAVEFREDAECRDLMNVVADFIKESKSRFEEYFGDVAEIHPVLDEDVPFLMGLLALHSPLASKRRWGYQMMMRGIATVEGAQGIYERYGIDFSRLMQLSAEASPSESEVADKGEVPNRRMRRRLLNYKFFAFLFFALFVIMSLILAIVSLKASL